MTTTVHKNLTGADLHEPKGADTALANQVYVSNGSGSGSWLAASSIITNTVFSTGDLKPTHKVTADTSWILWSDGNIGDGSSSATIRANADTANLFALYWNSYSNTLCPVSGGRGANAASDFASHKTISLPIAAGRVLGLAGAGAGLTPRTVGTTAGAETSTLVANQIPSLTSSGTNAISVTSTVADIHRGGTADVYVGGGSGSTYQNPTRSTITSTGSNSISVTYTNGSVQAVSLIQPTAFINVMIKL